MNTSAFNLFTSPLLLLPAQYTKESFHLPIDGSNADTHSIPVYILFACISTYHIRWLLFQI